MQAKIEVEVLQNLVDCASTPVNKKSPSEILSCLKVVAKKNPERILMVGTDLYNSINIQLEAGVTEEGEICVNQDRLQKLVKKLPKDKAATLKVQETNLVITCGKSKYTLPVLSGKDFPALPKPKSSAIFTLHAPSLLRLIQITKYAVASRGTRPSFEGISMEFSRNKLVATATDGHQLSESSIKVKAAKCKAMVPEGSLQSIIAFCKQFSEEDDPISVSVDEGQMYLWVQTLGCIVKLMEGTNIDSSKFIPSSITAEVKINRALMKAALERLIVIDPDKRYIEITMQGDKFRVTLAESTHGTGVEDIPVEVVIPGDIRIGISPYYLYNYFDSATAEWVNFQYETGETPLILRSGEQELLGLIMPVKL